MGRINVVKVRLQTQSTGDVHLVWKFTEAMQKQSATCDHCDELVLVRMWLLGTIIGMDVPAEGPIGAPT